MGCIPSKQKVLDGDSSTTAISGAKGQKERKQKKGPPSPIVADDAPPWVKGAASRVLTHKDGTIIITETQSVQS
ncbi:hypothetical protein PYCCODRAFT_1434606 [Trametes coccinea BRFM310]|uniref:Uncharacterized protein n=1 Tax=Trametes coccinea (strain BRFM310) TaxID=1353009 RepID=A0A1Y2IPZ5_TRAC3|nr:hypothetical protein PYCCODRAFT_1434606 [Trametes coccinea BRFM310]